MAEIDPHDECPVSSGAGARCRYLTGHPGRHSWQRDRCDAVAFISAAGDDQGAELVCTLPPKHHGLHYDKFDRIVWDSAPRISVADGG